MNIEITRIDTEERAVCSSLDVAETFGKRHRDVLRDIRKLDCSEKFWVRNFAQSEYINEQGHSQPHYIMTRDGFTFLVMGYTGEKVAQFKEAYIEQFNRMEQELYHRQTEREIMNKIRYAVASALSDILSTETVAAESQRGSEPQRKKSNSIDDETLLKAVAELVSATETHSWKGTATELANALNMTEKPYVLTRKLNVLQGRLLEEYHIYYETGRTYKERSVALVYAPLKLEIKTPLEAVKTAKIRK